MGIITGTILEKNDMSNGVHFKNKLKIKLEDGTAFVECRGLLKTLTDDFEVGENVFIEHKYEGKTSKKSGIEYNNLVATSIKKI